MNDITPGNIIGRLWNKCNVQLLP